ncbi:MAG: ABC transporter permease [Micropepsaceae bacterium]
MERLRRLRGLVIKELRQIVRDPGTLVLAAVLPALLLFLFGYAVSFDPKRLSVALVIEQPSAESASLQTAFSNVQFFDLRVGRDRREFEHHLTEGGVRAIVIVPADFSARLRQLARAPIQVLVDGSNANSAALIQGYIEGTVSNWLRQEGLSRSLNVEPPVKIEHRFWFNPEVSSHHFLLPGSIAIILTLVGTLLTAVVVSREWERGTMEALLSTPVGVVDLLIGKLLPNFLISLGSLALCVFLTVVVFGVPFRGSIGALLLVSSVFLVGALCQGLIISAMSRKQLASMMGASMSAFLPAWYFSDLVFETAGMPWPLPYVSYLIPARYLVSSLQTIFLAGDVWSVLLPNLAALVVIVGVWLSLVASLIRTRID